jgi:DNA-directed RNA polymerase specialized sigma24 family protein
LLGAYLLSGGSPVACAELAASRRLPEYVLELTRDWVLGEFAASGRPRSSLLGIMECLHRFAGKRAELLLRVASALEGLPDDQRRVFLLRYWEGAGVQEIADAVGRTRASVAGLLRRAMLQVRGALEGAEGVG